MIAQFKAWGARGEHFQEGGDEVANLFGVVLVVVGGDVQAGRALALEFPLHQFAFDLEGRADAQAVVDHSVETEFCDEFLHALKLFRSPTGRVKSRGGRAKIQNPKKQRTESSCQIPETNPGISRKAHQHTH